MSSLKTSSFVTVVIIATIPPFFNASIIALAILQLKKPKYMDRILVLVICLLGLPVGLKENLREEDNLSTRNKWPDPNVFFVQRFYTLFNSIEVEHASKFSKLDSPGCF